MRLYNYLKFHYKDYVIIFLKKDKLISFDEIYAFFKNTENLKKNKISYIIFDNLKIIEKYYIPNSLNYFYEILIALLK